MKRVRQRHPATNASSAGKSRKAFQWMCGKSTAHPTGASTRSGNCRKTFQVLSRLLALQGLHYRRSQHADRTSVQRAFEDDRGTSAHVIFIFATTESHKIPATILSRCQRHDFRRVSPLQTREHLKRIAEAEGVRISETGLGTHRRSE